MSNGGDERASEKRLSLDAILELLSNYQRRAMLRRLHDSDGQIASIDAVLNEIQDIEAERTGEIPGEDHLLSTLVHVHAPKLEEAGLIEYDMRSKEIRQYPNERIERALEKVEELEEEL